MPLYEYRCESCGRRFEVLQRLGATAAGVECPACGGARLERAFSTFARASGGDGGAVAAGASCAPGRAFT
jgi:putative FmdB family regulatory protein